MFLLPARIRSGRRSLPVSALGRGRSLRAGSTIAVVPNFLRPYAGEIARITGVGRALIELGSGSSVKTQLLLNALAPSAYVPIDICGDCLHQSAAALARRFPALAVHPVIAD